MRRSQPTRQGSRAAVPARSHTKRAPPARPRCQAAGAAQPAPEPVLLAVFVSGGGSNLKSLHAATLDGRVRGRVALVVTDKPDCGGAAFARAHGVPVLHWPDAGGGTPPLALASALLSARIRLLLLAGYLKLLPPAVVAAFPRAVLNVHPAPLPRFGGKGMYGAAVHAAVLASGLPFSGPTVHFVDGGYDTGPALCSRWDVPVVAGDTPGSLAARVLRAEWELYPAAVAAVVDGRVAWRRRGGRAGAAAGGGGGGGEAGDAGDEGVAEEEGGGDGDVWLPELLGGLAGAAAEVGDCTAAAPAGTSRTPGH